MVYDTDELVIEGDDGDAEYEGDTEQTLPEFLESILSLWSSTPAPKVLNGHRYGDTQVRAVSASSPKFRIVLTLRMSAACPRLSLLTDVGCDPRQETSGPWPAALRRRHPPGRPPPSCRRRCRRGCPWCTASRPHPRPLRRRPPTVRTSGNLRQPEIPGESPSPLFPAPSATPSSARALGCLSPRRPHRVLWRCDLRALLTCLYHFQTNASRRDSRCAADCSRTT